MDFQKLKKTGIPIRPIFSAIGTPSYNLSKFFVPILNPITKNALTTSNSYEFCKKLHSLQVNSDCYMVSYDVASLFTNIPVHETIEIIINKMFDNNAKVENMNKDQFKELLELSVLNSYFIFDGDFYLQHDGVGMGLPLGPTFANVFMAYHEENWLRDCPLDFKPIFYKRYVDDCFVIFRTRDQAEKFHSFLNSKHPNINFSIEHENNSSLSFLDIFIQRENFKFKTSVFRKSSFTGLGTSFFSFSPKNFKISAIKTLIYRAFHISSNYEMFHDELMFLKNFFQNNGYPLFIVEDCIKKFLDNIFNSSKLIPLTVPKLIMYCKLPYFGVQSDKMKSELINLVTKFFPFIDIKVILVNDFKIKNLFSHKERLPVGCMSSVVYKFCCASCDATYVGSTCKQLICRVQQHAGLSFRTNLPLGKPEDSSIRNHCHGSCKRDIGIQNFKILHHEASEYGLRLLESLYISKLKPSLNEMSSAFPLKIFHG